MPLGLLPLPTGVLLLVLTLGVAVLLPAAGLGGVLLDLRDVCLVLLRVVLVPLLEEDLELLLLGVTSTGMPLAPEGPGLGLGDGAAAGGALAAALLLTFLVTAILLSKISEKNIHIFNFLKILGSVVIFSLLNSVCRSADSVHFSTRTTQPLWSNCLMPRFPTSRLTAIYLAM